jgi:hypothetical protein
MYRSSRFLAGLFALGVAVASPADAAPSKTSGIARVPRALAVTRRLPTPPAGVAELKFAEMFKSPVGPKGLEPTEQLRLLDGKRVRMVGYVVQQAHPLAGAFMLSPLPVVAGDEDESLADDIPPSAVLVRLPNAKDARIPSLPGLIQVSGTLHVGASEAGGRVTAARVDLDALAERALIADTSRNHRASR